MLLFIAFFINFTLSLLIFRKYFRGKRSDLSNDTILITGAANGIGRLLTLSLSRLCKNIIVIDKDLEGLKEISNLVLKQSRVQLICYECDLRHNCLYNLFFGSDKDAINKCAREIRENNFRITLLICNAGVVNGNYLLDIPAAKVDKVMKLNLMAPFYLIKEFLPGMLGSAYEGALDRIPKKLRVNSNGDISEKCFPHVEPRGHLVFLSSLASQVPCVALGDYCASKAGMSSLVDSLRLELDTLGLSEQIFVTDIRPYFVDTGMFEGVACKLSILPLQKPEKVAERIVEAIQYRERIVYIPGIARLIPVLQGILPPGIHPFLYRICGVLDQMNDFRRSNKKDDD
ncbi:hypothetical protein Aperf_G00000076568 [Anoplocephala perfoliata]